MQHESHSEKRARKKHTPYEENGLLRLGAYVLAGCAGVVTAVFHIRNSFYNKIKHSGGFQELRNVHHDEVDKLQRAAIHGTVPDFLTKLLGFDDKYITAFCERLEKIGIPTKGHDAWTSGTFKRWQRLYPDQRLGIVFSTTVSIGTVMGAYMLLNQNARLKHDSTNVQKRLEELDRPPQQNGVC